MNAFKLSAARARFFFKLFGRAARPVNIGDRLDRDAGHARIFADLRDRRALHVADVRAQADEQVVIDGGIVEPIAAS